MAIIREPNKSNFHWTVELALQDKIYKVYMHKQPRPPVPTTAVRIVVQLLVLFGLEFSFAYASDRMVNEDGWQEKRTRNLCPSGSADCRRLKAISAKLISRLLLQFIYGESNRIASSIEHIVQNRVYFQFNHLGLTTFSVLGAIEAPNFSCLQEKESKQLAKYMPKITSKQAK